VVAVERLGAVLVEFVAPADLLVAPEDEPGGLLVGAEGETGTPYLIPGLLRSSALGAALLGMEKTTQKALNGGNGWGNGDTINTVRPDSC